ncbi:MAG: LacI family DNA-binding transcriptional regulator [Lachnospiraceae bacterium]|nr:LacI family DNA-binding transcriptional regulator [Lachnospiraceae bacterium]
MTEQKVTIQDIADALGISKTTVSRAISGKGRISAATTERVQAFIREHNYTPSAVAKGLAEQKTYNIGVVCPNDYEIFDLQYFHRCLEGVSDIITDEGYDILICLLHEGELTNLKRVVEKHKVDGIVLTRTMFEDPVADYLKECGIPLVVIGSSPDPELSQVDNDHFAACRELTSVLIGKGLKRIALIGGPNTHIITDTRRRGFEAAFKEAGIPVDPSLIFMDTDSPEQTTDVMREILKKKADGIICMDEKLTSYVLAFCKSRHLHIPEDFCLASFYNSSMLENSAPPVTSLDIDDRKLGDAAARLLLAKINGEEAENVMLKSYQIILRESTNKERPR